MHKILSPSHKINPVYTVDSLIAQPESLETDPQNQPDSDLLIINQLPETTISPQVKIPIIKRWANQWGY